MYFIILQFLFFFILKRIYYKATDVLIDFNYYIVIFY